MAVVRPPPYIFKIDELREHPQTVPLQDNRGYWVPTTATGWNYKSQEGTTGTYWFCDGYQLYPIPHDTLPPLSHFRTCSVFFLHGLGFYVLRGDGTAPGQGDSWHTLRFEHQADGSSYLTQAGANEALQYYNPSLQWPHRLLPNIYHGTPTQDPNQGGLRGELPIFLALTAMSMSSANVLQVLPSLFQGSQWRTHALHHGWESKRGVVVDVYTCPTTWAGGSSPQDLINLENGAYGKYFS